MDRDGTALVWQLDLAEPSLWLLRDTGPRDAAFTPDGTSLTLFEGRDAVSFQVGSRGAGHRTTLAQAEADANLVLDGFELRAPASAVQAEPAP